MEKDNPKEKTYAKDEVLIMFEKLDSKLSVIAEGVSGLDEKMDRGFNAVDERFDKLEVRLDLFKIETADNFKIINEYLSNMDDDMQEILKGLEKIKKNKVDKKEFSLWQKKVLSNEKEIVKMRSVIENLLKGKKISVKV